MDKFSDSNKKGDNKFQVINMNYKLKKIKNRKKNNYKNIKIFDVLDNTSNDIKKNTNEEKIESFSNNNHSNNIIEGFPDSYYDGIDMINEKGSKEGAKDIRQIIIDFINKLYDYVNSINNIMARKLAMSLSNNKASDSDVILIRQYFAWSESILAASYVTYNIYFIMYFKTKENVELIDISRKNAYKMENAFVTFLMFFIEYSLIFPEMLNKLIVEIIPNFLNEQRISKTFIFSLIFFSLIPFFKYSAIFFKNFIINSIMGNTPILGYTFLVIMGIAFSYDFIQEGIKKLAEKPVDGIINFVFFVLYWLVRGGVVFLLGVPTAVFFVICYILLYSSLALFIYLGIDFSIYNKIDEYVKIAPREYKENVCDTDWIPWLMEFFGINMTINIVSLAYSNLLLFSFIVLLNYGCVQYYNQISENSGDLKYSLMFINFVLLLILFSIILRQFSKEYMNK
jgi:hypothetical protein